MKTLNFALVGAGKFGKNYLRLLQNTPGINLRTVVTKDSARSENLPLSIEHYTNLERVLKNPEINCVVIVTPPKTHFALAKAALEAGKHVLLEKPMAVNIKEAEELKRVVGKSDKVFMVGFQYLFNSYIRYLKKEIESGTFGEIKNVSSEHFQSPPREDVTAFWDAAPHPLSIFQFIFNPKKIIKTFGEEKNLENPKDYAKATVQFDRGPMLNITTSWPGKPGSRNSAALPLDHSAMRNDPAEFSLPGGEKVRKLTIQGEKITAILDETKTVDKFILISNNDGKVTVPAIDAGEPSSETSVAFSDQPRKAGLTEVLLPGEPLKNEVAHFIDCIQNRKTPLTNVNFGYLNTKWLEEISSKI